MRHTSTAARYLLLLLALAEVASLPASHRRHHQLDSFSRNGDQGEQALLGAGGPDDYGFGMPGSKPGRARYPKNSVYNEPQFRRPDYRRADGGDDSNAGGVMGMEGEDMDAYRDMIDRGEKIKRVPPAMDFRIDKREYEKTKYGRNMYAITASKVPWNNPDQDWQDQFSSPEPDHPTPAYVTRALLMSHSLIQQQQFEQTLGNALEFELENFRDPSETVIALEAMSKAMQKKTDRDIYTAGFGFRAQTGHERQEHWTHRFGKIHKLDYTVVMQVGCGMEHMVALSDTGNIYTWGDGTVAQLSDALANVRLKPYWAKALRGQGVKAVYAGGYHNMAVDKKDNLYSWGWAEYGQTCRGMSGPAKPTKVTQKLKKAKVLTVGLGLGHSIVALQNGTVFACGLNNAGQLGTGSYVPHPKPTNIKALEEQGVVGLASGCEHSLALTDQGDVWSWGKGAMGQLGHSDWRAYTSPKKIDFFSRYRSSAYGGSPIKHIAAGCHHSFAVSEENIVFAWGYNRWGQLGVGDTLNRNSPRPVSLFNSGIIPVHKIDAGRAHSALVTETGQYFAWGSNKRGQLGWTPGWRKGENIYWKSPTEVRAFRFKGAREICANFGYTAVVTDKAFIGKKPAATAALKSLLLQSHENGTSLSKERLEEGREEENFELHSKAEEDDDPKAESNETTSLEQRAVVDDVTADELGDADPDSFEYIRDQVEAEQRKALQLAQTDPMENRGTVGDYDTPLGPEEEKEADEANAPQEIIEVDADKAILGDYEHKPEDVEFTEDETEPEDADIAHHGARKEHDAGIMALMQAKVRAKAEARQNADPEPPADANEDSEVEEDNEGKDQSAASLDDEDASSAAAETIDEDDTKDDDEYFTKTENATMPNEEANNGESSTIPVVSDEPEVPPDGSSFDEDAAYSESSGYSEPAQGQGNAGGAGASASGTQPPPSAEEVENKAADEATGKKPDEIYYQCPKLFAGHKPSKMCHIRAYPYDEAPMHPNLQSKVQLMDDFKKARPLHRGEGLPTLPFDYYERDRGIDPQLEPGTSISEMLNEANRAVQEVNQMYQDVARNPFTMVLAGDKGGFVPKSQFKNDTKGRETWVNLTRKQEGEGFERDGPRHPVYGETSVEDDALEEPRRQKVNMQDGEVGGGADLLVNLYHQRETNVKLNNISSPKVYFFKKVSFPKGKTSGGRSTHGASTGTHRHRTTLAQTPQHAGSQDDFGSSEQQGPQDSGRFGDEASPYDGVSEEGEGIASGGEGAGPGVDDVATNANDEGYAEGSGVLGVEMTASTDDDDGFGFG